jgi:predicted small lipoprotein YifL
MKVFVVIAAFGVLALAGCGSKAPATPKQNAAEPQKSSVEAPKTPLIKKAEVADWCIEHGVPESACTQCKPELVEVFTKKGDWCAEHNLPKSQCITCDPSVKAKLEALKPKAN